MIFTLAVRNIRRQKRRTAFTVLTMVGGFALASWSIGIADGSYNNVIDLFTRTQTGHIQVHAGDYLDRPSLYKTVDDYREVGAAIQGVPGVESWSPQVFAAGLGSVGDKSGALQLIGIDPVRESATTGFDRKVKEGRPLPGPPGHWAVIGKGLARTLSAGIDSQVVVVSQAADGSIANDVYSVCGVMESADEVSDRMALYLHIADAQRLLALEGRVHQITVNVTDIRRTPKIVKRIRASLKATGLDVQPWQVVAGTFYRSMEADKRGNYVMHFIIMLIVSIGVLNTVLMSVLERTREYGVLRALGTTPRQIFAMVMLEVLCLSVVSIVLGCVIGTALNLAFHYHGIAIPATEVGGMVMNSMTSEVNANTLLTPVLLVLFSALAVSVFPARMASRIEPARAMRMH